MELFLIAFRLFFYLDNRFFILRNINRTDILILDIWDCMQIFLQFNKKR